MFEPGAVTKFVAVEIHDIGPDDTVADIEGEFTFYVAGPLGVPLPGYTYKDAVTFTEVVNLTAQSNAARLTLLEP